MLREVRWDEGCCFEVLSNHVFGWLADRFVITSTTPTPASTLAYPPHLYCSCRIGLTPYALLSIRQVLQATTSTRIEYDALSHATQLTCKHLHPTVIASGAHRVEISGNNRAVCQAPDYKKEKAIVVNGEICQSVLPSSHHQRTHRLGGVSLGLRHSRCACRLEGQDCIMTESMMECSRYDRKRLRAHKAR